MPYSRVSLRPIFFNSDVAAAHIFATRKEHAGHRFIMSSPKPISPVELAQIVREAQPSIEIVNLGQSKPSDSPDIFCSKNYESMQQPLRPYAESIRDMAEAMLANGSVQPKFVLNEL